jgi:hypothetical protein
LKHGPDRGQQRLGIVAPWGLGRDLIAQIFDLNHAGVQFARAGNECQKKSALVGVLELLT